MKEVHLLGRRGPVQAAFTPKELRELLSMPGVQVGGWMDGWVHGWVHGGVGGCMGGCLLDVLPSLAV